MVRLELPFPPSVNTYWRHVGHKVLISAGGRRYRQDVGTAVLLAGKPKVEGPLALRMWLYPPDLRRRDCDNSLKACLDALQHAGVYDDDNQIVRLTVERRDKVQGGKAVVRIRELREV